MLKVRITFSAHAFDRLDYREVSKGEAERVIRQGKLVKVQDDGLVVKDAEVDGRRLRVVYSKIGPKPWTYHIITVIEL